MWRVLLKLAVAVGQSEWAKAKAAEIVAKLLKKAHAKADAIATAGGHEEGLAAVLDTLPVIPAVGRAQGER